MKILAGWFLVSACLFGQTASEARRIDFTQAVLGIDGKTIQNGDAKTPLTLGDVAVTALEAQLEEDRQASGADKFKLDELARKIYKKTAVVLTVEEITTIKTRIGKAYAPAIVGASWRILDPATAEPTKTAK